VTGISVRRHPRTLEDNPNVLANGNGSESPPRTDPMSWDSYYNHVGTAYDDIAAEYDETVGQYAVSQRAKKLALRMIRDLSPPQGKLLDIGCYTGIEALALARQGFRVVGVDLSPQMVTLANAKARRFRLHDNARFYPLRASDLALLGGDSGAPFDTAYSVYGTLNLEPQLHRFKVALAGMLRERGAFVCGLLNPTVLYELVCGPILLKFHGYRKLAKVRVKTHIGLGDGIVAPFLYTPHEFGDLMRPEFEREGSGGLHLLYPPPRRRGALDLWWIGRALDSIERVLETRAPFASLGFFSLLVLRKV